jgi:hypothetical protein
MGWGEPDPGHVGIQRELHEATYDELNTARRNADNHLLENKIKREQARRAEQTQEEYKERAEMEMFRREQEKTMMAKSKQDKPIPQKSQNNDDLSPELRELLEGVTYPAGELIPDKQECIKCGAEGSGGPNPCVACLEDGPPCPTCGERKFSNSGCDECIEDERDANTQKNEEDSSSQESGGLLSKLNPF